MSGWGAGSEVYGDYDTAKTLHLITGVNFDFEAMGQSLDCIRDFYGVGIMYSEDECKYIIRRPITKGKISYVVVTKIPDANALDANKEFKDAVKSPELSKEITSTALSCGCFFLSLTCMAIGGIAAPVTGGASLAVTALGYAGTVASFGQCINGSYRVFDITMNEGHGVAWLDSQNWYTTTSTLLDVVGLASAGGALNEIVITYRAMKGASSLKMIEWLRLLPRHERKRLTEIIIRARNPGISNAAIKGFIAVGKYPKRFASDAVQAHMCIQLMNAINSMFTVAGSKLSGVLDNPGSLFETGAFAVGFVQPVETSL